MSKPVRYQRKRTRGYRMPPNTISVCRPSRLGNPFVGPEAIKAFRWYAEHLAEHRTVVPVETWRPLRLAAIGMRLDDSIRYFNVRITGRIVDFMGFKAALREARGKNVACFCPVDKPCHGDVILEIANR